jgi:very-short-patch-repair endonuclease
MDEEKTELKFESDFEKDVYEKIINRGYYVRTQVPAGEQIYQKYRIDLVVEGMRSRLAVECDGDKWHGPDRYEEDMARQRQLERAGWKFFRIRASDFYLDPDSSLEPLWEELNRLGIKPGGKDACEKSPPLPIKSANSNVKYKEELSDIEEVKETEEANSLEVSQNFIDKILTEEEIDKAAHESELITSSLEVQKQIKPAIDLSSLKDPLPETLSKLLSDNDWKCSKCEKKMELWIGQYGPFLQCPECKNTDNVDEGIIKKAFELLQIPCKNCGEVMIVVWSWKWKGIFPGCSGYPKCKKGAESWKDLRNRLKQKEVRDRLGIDRGSPI